MPDARDTIFISHATPEDNNFTIWLASRLQLLGYKVWIDRNSLVGGEKFWEDIDQVIRNRAAKFILVYSNSICAQGQAGKLKDGIYKEYSLAESISKQNNLSEFIILANIDNAAYNLFIGSDRLNQIPFFDNWAQGLIQLQKKLVKDSVTISDSLQDNEFNNWFQYEYIIPNPIIEKKELYYSNLWPIDRLPEFFFIHEFRKAEQAKFFYDNHKKYPLSRISNYISSFEGDLLYDITSNDFEMIPVKIHQVRLMDMLMGDGSPIFPTNKDATNHFKSLLKMIFHLLMKNRGMYWYEMANKKFAYFYTPVNLNSLKVKFNYPFRKGNASTKLKNLVGVYKRTQKWHYAISAKPILTPMIGFSLKNHLTFTSDGFQVWMTEGKEIDTTKIQTHRRSKGKMFFNEEWRDMFLAYLHGLKKDGVIELQLSHDFTLQMSPNPELYWSKFGYFDPKDKTRQGLLSTYADEDDEDVDIDIAGDEPKIENEND